ncbi:MAG: Lrp/AsnC family transcriptional regulator [Candidatus Thorarchaeota archaeon]
MDEIDLRMFKHLILKPRMTFRELADELDISLQAVHRRMKLAQDNGVVAKFAADISLGYLNATTAVIFGESGYRSLDEIVSQLSENNHTSWVLIGSGNYLYVGGILRSIEDLEEYSDFVIKKAQISNPTIGLQTFHAGGIFGGGKQAEMSLKLSKLDMRIIKSLHNDARKSLTVIADELTVSARTVRRRLDRMVEDNVIEMGVVLNPTKSGDILAALEINLVEGSDKNEVKHYLNREFFIEVDFFRSFSNLPNFLMGVAWTFSLAELGDLIKKLESIDEIESAVPIVLYSGHYFDTWRATLLDSAG